MKIAVVGSRTINVNIADYIPDYATSIISGGAKGIDSLAERYADIKGIDKIIFKPEYNRYGKGAPIIRNKKIVEEADEVIAIWNGSSRGTKFTIEYAKKIGVPVKVYII